MAPQGGGSIMLIDPLGGPRRSWDRLGSALFSSCGLTSIFGRFGGLLEVHLGSFWAFGKASWGRFAFLDAFWCFLVPQKSIYSSIQPINSSIHPPINSSTHQLIGSTVQLKNTIVDDLIIPSTHRFNPLTHQLTRLGSLLFRLEFWLRF